MLVPIQGLTKTDKGVYILSLISPRVSGRSKLVKIGMADKSLPDRLDQYHTYFHSSFYLYFVIVCNNPEQMEKAFHDYFDRYRYTHKEYRARFKSEWFELTNAQISFAVEKFTKQYKEHVRKIFFLPYEADGSLLRREFGREKMPRMQTFRIKDSYEKPAPKSVMKAIEKLEKPKTKPKSKVSTDPKSKPVRKSSRLLRS